MAETDAEPTAPMTVATETEPRLPSATTASHVPGAISTESTPSSTTNPAGRLSAAICRNCGASAEDRFCANCGQSTDVGIPTLLGVLGDFLDGFFNLDSRIWRTLIPLVARPGFLTREYFQGRRASYVPPFRLYLVLSLVYFVVASFTGNDVGSGQVITSDAEGGPTTEWQCDWVSNVLPEASGLLDSSVQACENALGDGGRTLLRAFSDRIPMMIFVMIPLFAAGLKFLYPFTRHKFVEHLFFLFHVHAFVFIVATVGAVATAVNEAISPDAGTPALLMFALWLYVLYYGYRALRNVYAQGWLLTSLKYSLLVVGYFVLMALTFLTGLVYTVYTL